MAKWAAANIKKLQDELIKIESQMGEKDAELL